MANRIQFASKAWFEDQFDTLNSAEGDRWGHRWRGSQRWRYTEVLNVISHHIPDGFGGDILDIGCALGDFTRLLFQRYPNACLFGTDISENAIQAVKKILPTCHFKTTALPKIGFERQFDYIFAQEVICYLAQEERLQAIIAIKAHLKPGGMLIFTSHLDDGTTYFSVEDARDLIGKHFEIVDTAYNFAKFYSCLEAFFLRPKYFVDEVLKIKNHQKGNAALLSPNKQYVYRLICIPFLGKLLIWLMNGISIGLRRALSPITPAKIISSVSEKIAPELSRSHIFIIARKNRAK